MSTLQTHYIVPNKGLHVCKFRRNKKTDNWYAWLPFSKEKIELDTTDINRVLGAIERWEYCKGTQKIHLYCALNRHIKKSCVNCKWYQHATKIIKEQY